LDLNGRKTDLGEKCIMKKFITCTLHRILLGWLNLGGEVGGTCGTHWEGRGVYRVLVGRPECKKPLGRPKHRWEDNIKMDLREIGIDGANWITLAQDRLQWRDFVSTVMDFRVP
jgi:hypothetical protein